MKRAAVAAVILLPPLGLCFTSLSGIDYETYFRPHARLLIRDYMPEWNPYQYAGIPFVGGVQLSPLYPPNYLLLNYAMYVGVHLAIAGWGMYRLTRGFRLDRAACVLAAVAYELSFAAAGEVYAGHVAALCVTSWTPMLLFCVLRSAAKPSIGPALGLAGCTAAILTGGHPQYAAHAAAAAVLAVAWKARSWTAIGAIAGAAGLGVAIASAHLVPAIEVARWSERGGGIAPSADVLVPRELGGLLTPSTNGVYWYEKAVYVGLVPLAAAVAGLRRRPALFFAVLGAVATVAAMTPIGSGVFRLPARAVWLATPALAAMSAFGVAGLRRWLIAGAILAAVADLAYHGLRVQKFREARELDGPPWYAERIGPERADHRVLDVTDVSAAPIAHGFRLLNGYSHPLLRSLEEFATQGRGVAPDVKHVTLFGESGPAHAEELEALNVRWVIERDHGGKVIRELSPRPWAWLESGEARPERPTPDSIRVTCRSERAQTLRISESWMPGWRATVDGAAAATGEGPLLAVAVPAGESTVDLVYDPTSRRVGRLVSLGGVVAAAMLVGLAAANRKNRRIPEIGK